MKTTTINTPTPAPQTVNHLVEKVARALCMNNELGRLCTLSKINVLQFSEKALGVYVDENYEEFIDEAEVLLGPDKTMTPITTLNPTFHLSNGNKDALIEKIARQLCMNNRLGYISGRYHNKESRIESSEEQLNQWVEDNWEEFIEEAKYDVLKMPEPEILPSN